MSDLRVQIATDGRYPYGFEYREPTVEELKAALWKLIEHDDAEYYKVYDTYKTGGWRAVVLFLTGEEWDA